MGLRLLCKGKKRMCAIVSFETRSNYAYVNKTLQQLSFPVSQSCADSRNKKLVASASLNIGKQMRSYQMPWVTLLRRNDRHIVLGALSFRVALFVSFNWSADTLILCIIKCECRNWRFDWMRISVGKKNGRSFFCV